MKSKAPCIDFLYEVDIDKYHPCKILELEYKQTYLMES